MLSHNAIFRLFWSASVAGGADSGVIGVNGSVNSSSARAILHELDAKNRTILDFGAGDGKFLICAAVAGANHAIEIEFFENIVLVRWLKYLKDPIACIVFGLVFR